MAFCGAPGVASLADAARGPIAVDATSNGFVLVLYRALAAAGIDRAGCDFQKVGGVRERFEALTAGRVSATMLVPPFIEMALSRGCIRIFDGAELAPAYPGVVATARGAWTDCQSSVGTRLSGRAAARQRVGDEPGATMRPRPLRLSAPGYSPDAAARLVQNAVPGLQPSRPGWDETIGLRRDVGLLHDEPPRFEDIADLELLASARVAGNR